MFNVKSWACILFHGKKDSTELNNKGHFLKRQTFLIYLKVQEIANLTPDKLIIRFFIKIQQPNIFSLQEYV